MNLLKSYWFIIVAIFAVSGWVTYAEVSHKDARDTKELVKILGERHIAEDAEEEGYKKGERETIERLCREGKLEGRECEERE